MGKYDIDLTNQQFGLLTVLYPVKVENRNGRFVDKWHCSCSNCGGFGDIDAKALINGTTKSCGCLVAEVSANTHARQIEGMVFGTLKAMYPISVQREGRKPLRVWHCICEKCGFEIDIETGNLTRFNPTKCPKCKAGGYSKGDKIGKITIEDFIYEKNERNRHISKWVGVCECGNPVIVSPKDLKTGHKLSCGCLRLEKVKEAALNRRINLKGKKINELTPIYSFQVFENGKPIVYWHCECSCGNPTDVITARLVSGNVYSCGCKTSERISEAQTIDLIGKKFGKLTVLKRVTSIGEPIKYKCQCDCGSQPCIVSSQTLLAGKAKSCGCYRKELPHIMFTTHGLSKHPLYKKFYKMIGRCYDHNNIMYHAYGGRGIRICDEWLNDFTKFYDWAIKSGWKEGLTIDRIDNDGDYCPENCQWLTRVENINKGNRDRYYKMQQYKMRSLVKVVNHRDKGLSTTYDFTSQFVWN